MRSLPSKLAAGVVGALSAVGMAAVLLLLLPEAAHACAVCFDSSDENRQAFLATTAFLSLLPLGMVAGAGYWLRNKARQADRQADVDAAGD